MDLPRYRCHKVVQAVLIFDVRKSESGGATLYPQDARFSPIYVSAEWLNKHNPQPGQPGEETRGYFVRYEDGYTSWSPVQAFEDGYTLI